MASREQGEYLVDYVRGEEEGVEPGALRGDFVLELSKEVGGADGGARAGEVLGEEDAMVSVKSSG
jgi:hypothetical protein